MPDVLTLISQPLNYAPSTALPLLIDFLAPARKMRAPVIESLHVRVNMTAVSTGTSGGPARIFPQIFSRVQLGDVGGDRINVRGSSLRIINQYEYGEGYTDGINLAASQAGVAFEQYFRLPFNPLKARMRSDFKLPLQEFLDGGYLTFQTNAAAFGAAQTWIAMTTGTIQVIARVVEDRKRELKSRMTWRDFPVNAAQNLYPVGGSLRAALYYAGEVAEQAATKLAAQNFASQTLDYANMPLSYLVDDYKMESKARINKDAAGTIASSEDAIIDGYVAPLWNPRQDQKTPQMPDMTQMEMRTDGAVTTGNLPQLIICAITDRAPEGVRRTLKASSYGQAAADLDSHGKVVDATARKKPLAAWNRDLVRRLPVKLEIPAGKR